MCRLTFHRWVRGFVITAMAVLPTGSQAQQAVLHTWTSLVFVPTLVESKSGEPVFNLEAKDFLVKDNGIEQKIKLDTETDRAAISMVVLVQTGRSAVLEFHKFQGLPIMVDALAGNTRHRIAVVEFDSQPRMVQNFSNDAESVEHALYSIQPGDGGAAILDSVWYAVDMLADEPPQNQRVILLISESRDHGSRTPIKEVLRKIGRSDVIVYSLTFNPARSEFWEGLKTGGGGSLLTPVLLAIQAVRRNTAAAIPQMTGGQYLRFNNGKQLDGEIATLANQVHNRYILSFQPSDPKPGLHLLNVDLRQPLEARILARTSYWAASQSDISIEETTQPGLPPGTSVPSNSPQD